MGENTFGADYIISFLPASTVFHELQILSSAYCSANEDFKNADKNEKLDILSPKEEQVRVQSISA